VAVSRTNGGLVNCAVGSYIKRSQGIVYSYVEQAPEQPGEREVMTAAGTESFKANIFS